MGEEKRRGLWPRLLRFAGMCRAGRRCGRAALTRDAVHKARHPAGGPACGTDERGETADVLSPPLLLYVTASVR